MTEVLRDVEHAAVRVLADASSLDDAAPQVLEGICRALDWQFGALWVVDGSPGFEGNIRCTDLWRRDDPLLAAFEEATRDRSFRFGEGLPGRVWENEESAWVRDVLSDPNFPRAEAAVESGLRGAFAFPIRVDGTCFGVMEFFSEEIHEPDPELLTMLETVGSQIGHFVERERLGRRLVFHAALLEAQGEAAIDGILVVSPDDRVLYWNRRFLEIWEVPEDVVRSGDRQRVINEQVRATSDPEQFLEIATAVFDDPEATSRDEISLVDGRVIDRWTSPVRDPDGTLLGRVLYYRDVSDQKRAENRLRENERWSSFLAEVSVVMSQTLDYEANLNRLAEMTVPVLCDWCAIHVLDESDLRLVALAHQHDSERAVSRRARELFPIDPQAEMGLAAVVRTGSSLLFEEIPDEVLEAAARDEDHLERLRELGFRSAVIVPLVCRERVLGTLTMLTAESGRRYSKEDLRHAEDLAARAAFPIDNARLYEERARVAQTLQESLLPPKLPEIPGVELAARYRAVAESAEVGGDFYDVFPAGSRSWGVVLGDVSGKGVEAATLTSLARHTLRTATMATQRSSEILSMLNAALLDQTDPDDFCTAVYALLEPRFGRLKVTVSSGGHPLPYVVRSNGTLEPLHCEGTLLGVVPKPELEEVSADIEFGDKLVLYTDGIFDVGPRDSGFEQHEMRELFSACSKRGVRAAADLIEQTIVERQGGRARDDFAVLVIGLRASIFRRARTPRLWSRSGDPTAPASR